MAIIAISNNINKIERLHLVYTEAGYRNYSRHQVDGINIIAYEKKRKPESNFMVLKDSDFIAVIGTLVFEGHSKSRSLESLYENFRENEIAKFRKNILGNYIIAIRKSGNIYVFTDKYQVIPLYCYHENNMFSATNSCWHLARSIGEIHVDEQGLIEEALFVSPVGSNTPFKNIKKLFGYTCVKLRGDSVTEMDIDYSDEYAYVSGLEFKELVSRYSGLIVEEASKIKKAYSSKLFGLQQTGGLDNRTIFAALMSLGIKPSTFYGVGNTPLTNTNPLDLEIVDMYRDKFDLNSHIMDWRHEWGRDKLAWNKQVIKYGFLQSLYGGSQNFFNEFEYLIDPMPDFIECGYYGEVLRQREWAYQRKDSRKDGYTIDQFLNGYLFGPGYGGLFDEEFSDKLKGVRASIKDSYLKELKKANFKFDTSTNEENFFSIDSWSKVEWTHMRNCNSTSVNFLNQFTSSIALFGTEKLHDFALNIPARYLQNGKFQLAVIDAIYPEALEIPILSHGKRHSYKPETGMIPVEGHNRFIVSAKDLLRPVINKNKLLRSFSYFVSRPNCDTQTIESIRSTINELLSANSDLIKCRPDKYSGSIVYLCLFAHYVNAIGIIKQGSQINIQ